MNNFDFSTLSLNKANKIGKFGDIINSPENIGRIIDTNPLIIEVTKSGTIHTYIDVFKITNCGYGKMNI